MLGPAGRFTTRLHAWASVPGGNGVTPIDHDVKRTEFVHLAVNGLLNWQVASAAVRTSTWPMPRPRKSLAPACSACGRLAEEIVNQVRQPRQTGTAELLRWLDAQTKRNLVITFGGGVNEVMRRDDRRVWPQSAKGAQVTG